MAKAHNDIDITLGPSVFVSYARSDQAIAIEFYHLLGLDGFKPWIDKFNLIAGQRWESEIDRAVKESDCVVVLLSKESVDHRGYVQKEISLALEAASRETEEGIFVLPLCLDESPVPNRLTHLHSVRSSEPPQLIGARYLAVQRAVLMRAGQLGERYDVRSLTDHLRFSTPKGGVTSTDGKDIDNPLLRQVKVPSPSRLLWTGDHYLVRGRNPTGSTYAGVARLDVHEGDASLNVTIGMHYLSYTGTFDGKTLALKGSHEVTYDIGDGIFRGVWGKTGYEELIPASPFAKPINS